MKSISYYQWCLFSVWDTSVNRRCALQGYLNAPFLLSRAPHVVADSRTSPMSPINARDAAFGAMLGAFVGDAAGAVLEFLGRPPTAQEVPASAYEPSLARLLRCKLFNSISIGMTGCLAALAARDPVYQEGNFIAEQNISMLSPAWCTRACCYISNIIISSMHLVLSSLSTLPNLEVFGRAAECCC